MVILILILKDQINNKIDKYTDLLRSRLDNQDFFRWIRLKLIFMIYNHFPRFLTIANDNQRHLKTIKEWLLFPDEAAALGLF